MNDINSVEAGTVLDLIGVVETVGDVTPIVTRTGKETNKRPLQIRDNSNASIEVGALPLRAFRKFSQSRGQSPLEPSCADPR